MSPTTPTLHQPVPAALARTEVLRAGSGEPVALGELWRQRPAAVVFVRHFG